MKWQLKSLQFTSVEIFTLLFFYKKNKKNINYHSHCRVLNFCTFSDLPYSASRLIPIYL